LNFFQGLRDVVVGAPLDPLSRKTRHSVALVAFFAWVGLGADGISSSCYGPAEAFRALGPHTHLGPYLALATALTVFIIALAYNQVIELFPTGGGGYRVATRLLGPHAGLVTGAALLVDYVLTIAISVAAGVDALFSLMPLTLQSYKLAAGLAIIVALLLLNLRGMKEAIRVLLPIFLGFICTHAVLIAYGILAHASEFGRVIPEMVNDTASLASTIGWAPMAAFLLLAYAHGGGTYTGLEAVSNNVNVLAEPREHTGKLTMMYMALSLAFTAGGIILVYLLWNVTPVEGKTYNAVAFGAVLREMGFATAFANHWALLVVLALEAGLLFVAANTGFLGGTRQHGGGFLGAAQVPLPVDAPGHRERHRRHGSRGPRHPVVDRRQRNDPGGAVFDQRVPDILGVALGAGNVLVAPPRAAEMARAPDLVARRIRGVHGNPIVAVVESSARGRMGGFRHHRCDCRGMHRRAAPLQLDQGGAQAHR
jgi:amino acid transporter